MKTCPQCGGLLNATATVTLYDVEVQNGEIVNFDGGPVPQSEESFLELINAANPTIVCVNGHPVESN